MGDDRDDDSDYRTGFPFFGGFGGFGGFFRDMDRQFEEMDKHFQEIASHFEDISLPNGDRFKDFGGIRTGFHPPSMDGGGPPLQQDPRDQMLKGDSEESPSSAQNQPSEDRLSVWTSPDIRLSHNIPGYKSSFFRTSKKILHPDGTVEQVEKTTKDGRTCTTTTITDPNGKTTTTTTCDKPAIGGAPGVISPDRPQESGNIAPSVPSVNTDLTKEDAGFFSRLFGNFGFKPKD